MSVPRQIAVLTLLTTILVGPHLFKTGTNIVTHTYAFGSSQFWLKLSPYTDPQGAGDWFKYSPLFAWAYSPFAALHSSSQALIWGMFNAFCFWMGVSLWFPWKKLESKLLWLGFVFCSMESDGSFRYQQMNAALVGLCLTGLFLYKNKKLFWAGALLTIITNIKVLPGLFWVGLVYPVKRAYGLGTLLGVLLCIIVPLYVWGWDNLINYHLDWYHLLQRDTQTDGLLDIATVLKRSGLGNTKLLFLYPLAFLSLSLFFIQRIFMPLFKWELWISLGLLTLLLVNPRTESPTFVLAGPVYLFLLRYILTLQKTERAIALTFWGIGIFLVTLCMNDIWPKAILNPSPWRQLNKTYGVLLLWTLTYALILLQNKKVPKKVPVYFQA